MKHPLHRAILSLAMVSLVACGATGTVPAQEGGLTAPRILEGMEPDRGDLDLRTTPVVRAVQRAADSVVSIYVLERGRDNAAQLEGQGSGVIVDASGLVITNWHVVATVAAAPDGRQLQVRLRDDRRLPAQLISTSPSHDLALLQLLLEPGESVQPVVAGRSDSLMIGETVIAIGNPQGQANTVTVGVLSADNRSIRVRAPDGRVRDYTGLLQTDAAINQGNSGGALLDITGKLIGINNAMQQGVENIGFAIPVDTVKQVFDEGLARAENLATAWIGAAVEDRDGAVIARDVIAGGPAARAGLRVGDRIVAVGERQLASELDFYRALAIAEVGQPVSLRLQRGSDTPEVSPVVLDAAAREVALRIGLEIDGITIDDDEALLRSVSIAYYTNQRARPRFLPVALRVRSVYPDSSAARAGFEAGDVMLASAVTDMFFRSRREMPFRSLQDLADRLRDAQNGRLAVVVLRDGRFLEGEVEVAPSLNRRG